MQAFDGLGSGSDLITGEAALSVCLGSASGAKSGFGDVFPMLARGEAITGELEPELVAVPWCCFDGSEVTWENFIEPCSI